MAVKAGIRAEKCAKRRKKRKTAMWKACGRALWNDVEKEGGCGEKKTGGSFAPHGERVKKRPEGRFPQKYPQCGKPFPGIPTILHAVKSKKQAAKHTSNREPPYICAVKHNYGTLW